MAAGPAIEMWSKQSGDAGSSDGKKREVSMSRAFTVTLAADDALEVAYSALDLPLVGDVYPGTSFVIVRSLKAQRLSPILAVVTCDYRGEIGPSGLGSSPVDIEVNLTWSNSTTDEEIDEDWLGRPIVTKNGEPIEGISERISDQVLTVERNFNSINMYAIRAYLRSVNSDEFAGWPPGTCRLMEYRASNVITNGASGFWKVSASFQFREPYRTTPDKAWYKRLRHEGFYVREKESGKPDKVHIALDDRKAPVTRPVLLKEDGQQEFVGENAHWLEFQTLGELPYSALGLI